jgi:hypothetical protein
MNVFTASASTESTAIFEYSLATEVHISSVSNTYQSSREKVRSVGTEVEE